MSSKKQTLTESLESICEKYHWIKWKRDGYDVADLSAVEMQDLSILLTRVHQEIYPNSSSEPICDAPHSDIIFELLGRLMQGDTKDRDELISDLTSQLRNNAVCYYTRNGSLEEKLKKHYEFYCQNLTSLDNYADDAYDNIQQAAIDAAH